MFHADNKRLPHTAVCSANADAAHCTWRRRAAESDVTVRLDLCNSWRHASPLYKPYRHGKWDSLRS